MAKEKRPRWESEIWKTIQPNAKVCETCMFRPIIFDGVQLDRADTSNCQIFEYPDSKPGDVYFNGAECEFYEKEI
ncbi:MAG: hypothetical protein LBJ41_05740 [Treponema sp.]|nr:hypothetical protein [Treponema sp.]